MTETLPPLAGILTHKLGAKMEACVHCGYCLPTCPTYSELGAEMDSPRGRIYLIRALAEGRIQPTDTVARHLNLCLDCRACQTACPSGVRYGTIIEGLKTAAEPYRSRPLWQKLLRWGALRHLLVNPRLLSLAVFLLRFFQRSGARDFVTLVLPAKFREMEMLSPRIQAPPFTATSPRFIPAAKPGRGRVAFFTGCIMDKAMGQIHHATVRVLTRNGYDVVVPRGQTCCGALHIHNGMGEMAQELARRNIDAFEKAGIETVVINSAGCGAAILEYEELLHDDPVYAPRARKFARSIVDICVFLGGIGMEAPKGEIRRRAVYDEPCHMLHAQGISAQPKAILRMIPGLELLPLPEADWCCGSAGIYNMTQPEMSRHLIERKMGHIAASGADMVVTANPGCLIQIQAGMRRRGMNLPVVHLIELLDKSYRTGTKIQNL